ncbi:uncharacterized protein LOC108736718 [Agrilus planipennis]|uniref:Uncharacterized protein LOC108736718 n=1 Tax=Agrilus planipennis TaxID=224129 RepID=A0A1W4WX98_AGRPL|nr:uncharacterized protein LOC108736718 [Agrilus planipennis]
MSTTVENSVAVEEVIPVGRCLSETGLKLLQIWEGQSRPDVPSSTPKSEFMFNFPIETLPSEFPSINELEVPIIREIGVKSSIELLGDFFNCTDYKRNHLQFWFLDIVTDCLWRSQDDFRFPVDIQKRILEWILYMFKLIRSPTVNFSRKNFFRAFAEIVLIVGEIIDEEQEELPPPEQVFQLISDDNTEERSWISSVKEDDGKSSRTFSGLNEKVAEIKSVLEIQNNEDPEEASSHFPLPKKTFSFNEYKLSPSTTYSMTTERSEISRDISSKISSDKGGDRFDSITVESSLSLVSPDTGKKIKKPRVPLASEDNKSEIIKQEVSDEGKFEFVEEEECDVVQVDDHFEVLTVSEFSRTPREEDTCPSSLFKRKTLESEEDRDKIPVNVPQEIIDSAVAEEELDDEAIMKKMIFQQLWEQRLKDMDDSEKGWIPSSETVTEELNEEEEEEGDESEIEDKDNWFSFLDKAKKETQEKYRRKLFNFIVMWAVINFVFDYFYNKFQFSLIALAFKATPVFITQRLNNVWRIPKINKEEAFIPRDEKPKEKKEKKPKKGKKDKGKKGKKDKKGKKGKKEKPKKQKPAKLTKEQLKELERQRKEEERLALERLMLLEQELEQKRFMFPLKDGGTDEFYKSIFENWVKVDLDKVLGKKGKGKGKDKKKKKK